MMLSKRRGLVLLVAGLSILAYPAPPTSTSPVPDMMPAASLEDLERLEELAEWVFGDPGARSALDRGTPLTDAIRERRQAFDLFRGFADEGLRRQLLAELPYGSLIHEAASNRGLDSLLLAAVVEAESSFDPGAQSLRGAVGLMQVLPSTAAQYGEFDLRDPRANVHVGARYLEYLMARYDHDVELAVAAYNAGPGNVDRFGGIPPFRETRSYVQRVLSTYVEHHRRLWHEERELTSLLATVDL